MIDPTSPLHGLDAAGAARAELELYLALTGIDDITMQTVHAMHTDRDRDLRFGYRLVGSFLVDLGKFDEVVPEADARVSVRA
ncbi:MAG: hypothetical protein ABI867_06420 [Kofleriaceae bacterium]